MKFSAPLGDTVHARFPCSKLKLDNLFLHWLSLQETQKLVINPYCVLTRWLSAFCANYVRND